MIDRYLRFTLKRFLLIVGAWLVAVVLHNAVYAVFGFEDALFFIVAIFIIPLYIMISIVYTIVMKIKGK